MPTTRLCFLAAALICSLRCACAEPPVISLPSHATPAPLPLSAPASSLLGSWLDGSCLVLPPGVTLFETVSDTLTFRADGTFTQTVEKATGRVPSRGIYTVSSSRVTLSYLFGTQKPMQYEFSRTGDRLQLQPVRLGKIGVRTLSRVASPDLERPFL